MNRSGHDGGGTGVVALRVTIERALARRVAAPDRSGGDAGGSGNATESPVDRLYVRRVLRVDAERPAERRGDAASDDEVARRARRELDGGARGEDEVPVHGAHPLRDRDHLGPAPELEPGDLGVCHHVPGLIEGQAQDTEVVVPGSQPEGGDGRVGDPHPQVVDVGSVLDVEAARELPAQRDRVAPHRRDGNEQAVAAAVIDEDTRHLDRVLRAGGSGREVDVDEHGGGRAGAQVATLEGHRDDVRRGVDRPPERVPERRVRHRAVRDRVVVDVRDVRGGTDSDPAEVDHTDRDAIARIRHVERGGEDAGRVARNGAGRRVDEGDRRADGPAPSRVRRRAGVDRRAIATRLHRDVRIVRGVDDGHVGHDLPVRRGGVFLRGGDTLHRRGAAGENGEERETESRGLHRLYLLLWVEDSVARRFLIADRRLNVTSQPSIHDINLFLFVF